MWCETKQKPYPTLQVIFIFGAQFVTYFFCWCCFFGGLAATEVIYVIAVFACKPDRVQYHLLEGRGVIWHHPTLCLQKAASMFNAYDQKKLVLHILVGDLPFNLSHKLNVNVKCWTYSAPVSASLKEGVLSAVSGGWGLYGWWPTRLVPNQYHLLPYSHQSLSLMVRRSWCSISVGDLPFNLSHKRHANNPPISLN